MKRKLLFFLWMGLAFFLVACDSSTSSPSNNGENNGESSSSSEIPAPTNFAKLASNASVDLTATMYNNWIERFYVTFEEEVPEEEYPYLGSEHVEKVKNSARILWDSPTYTVSEGVGYGLLIMLMQGDKTRFDALWRYSLAYRVNEADGLYFMKWKINGFGVGTGESATDADLDIATALILAYEKWGEQAYLDDALRIAGSIYQYEVHSETKLLLPANSGGDLSSGYVYNISYFSPVALRLFAKYDSHDWEIVLNNTFTYMKMVQDAGRGLWPDWSNIDGIPTNPNNGSSTGKKPHYWGLEGVRIPWRLMWDYHWYGDDRSKVMIEKAAEFAMSQINGDIAMVRNGYAYQVDSAAAGGQKIEYQSSFCSFGMISEVYADYLTNCNAYVLNKAIPSGTLYFGPSLQMMYSQLINGLYNR